MLGMPIIGCFPCRCICVVGFRSYLLSWTQEYIHVSAGTLFVNMLSAA